MMYRYRHSGLTVASDIALPEWAEFAEADTSALPDIRIVLSDEPCADCPDCDFVAEDNGDVRFAMPGVGGWQVMAGSRIVLHPGLAAVPSEIRLFTLGTAWGALGYQRRHAMWHGSAVMTKAGRTTMFCGGAGEGKSTMAAAMLARGAVLVADDLSRVEPGKGRPLIHPSSTRIKLWRTAVDALGWQDRTLERDFMREDKFHCSVAHCAAGQAPIALDEIVVLVTGETIERTVLTGSEAVKAVIAGTVYRPELLDAMSLWAQQGAMAARIVAQCKVTRLTRPRDLARIDEVASLLEK